jgi:hypothetical protein
LDEDRRLWPVYEVLLAFLETAHPFFDIPQPIGACSINAIDVVRDFGFERIV